MQDDFDYLSREEAAAYASVAVITIDRRLRDGSLPKHYNDLRPGRVLIARSDLERLMIARPRAADGDATTR
jgi:hypothetical protein